MGTDWQEYRLEDCMDAIIDYRGKTPKKTDSGIPLITAKIIKNGRIMPVSEYIAEEDYDAWMRRGIPEPGDIVLTTEAPLGEVAQLDNRKIALAQRVITLRGKKGVLDNTFLKYLLLSNYVQHQLDGRGTGTTVKGIKQSELREVKLKFPAFHTQQKIGHILGTLDNKIELNRQINQTLEQMAQALFKSWFVDFDPVVDNALAAANPIPEALQARADRRAELARSGNTPQLPDHIRTLFPDRFTHHPDMGWIPEGWEVNSLDSLIALTGGGTPKTSISEYWDGNTPWFSVVDAPNNSDVFVIDTEKHVTQLGIDNSSTKLLRVGTTIISARGTVGKCAIVAVPMAMNQSCYAVNGVSGISDEFVYYLVRYQVSDLQQRSHGSVFSTITRDTFRSINVPFSGSILTQEFSKFVKPLFDKILANSKSIEELSKIRDTLLPKLISGELRLPDTCQPEPEKQPEPLAACAI